MNVSRAFERFPEEAALVGRMLAGYSDLEIDLMHCIKSVWGDLDTVLKAMYRTRGETQRIEVADAFGRQKYQVLGLGDEFEQAIAAIRRCLRIRNLYSHCEWWDDNSGQLAFANLEEIAKLNTFVEDLRGANIHHVSVEHLKMQFSFFDYTSDFLIWIIQTGNQRAGKSFIQNIRRPPNQVHPELYLP